MKLPKPAFDELRLHYKVSPESVHDCPRIYRKDLGLDLNTSALRMTEALMLANRLVESHAAIASLTSAGGSGKSFLLGRYGYKANLCPHGIARGAADVVYFLKDQWGRPTHSWRDLEPYARGTLPEIVQQTLGDRTGLIAFLKIDGHDGQGHLDLWEKKRAVGTTYPTARKIMFWMLE